MAYLGNSPVLSQQEYRNIDNISGSFNGSTTSFALLVNGVAPVPAPQSSNQCLISVNGVVQKPDDTGATGFRLSGGNIVFSAAPTSGQSFFGVILAGADYIYAGQNFPDGTVSAPPITFNQDLDTGFYRSGSGEVKFTANGANTVTFSSNGLTAPSFIPTSSSAPTNGVYLSAANTVAISTNGTGRLFVNSSGQVGVGTSSPSTALDVVGTIKSSATVSAVDNFRLNNASFSRVADADGGGGFVGGYNVKYSTGVKHDSTGALSAIYYNPGGTLRFFTNSSQAADTTAQERLIIDSSGRVGIGTSSPSNILQVTSSATAAVPSAGASGHFFAVGSSAYGITGGALTNGNSYFQVTRWDGTATNYDLLLQPNGGRVGIGTTNGTAGLSVLTYGTQLGAGANTYMTPSGRHHVQFGNVANGTDVYAGFTSDYATTSGSCNIVLQPTFNNTSQQAGAYVAGEATGLAATAITFGHFNGGATTGSNATKQERARIDSSGRLLVGTSTARSPLTHESRLQVEGTDYSQSTVSIISNASDGSGPTLLLGKSRSGSLNGNTVVQNGDDLGQLYFMGADGSDLDSRAAIIKAQVDGTPGANDMPGRLVFSTTPDGSASPTERMRISNNGVVTIKNGAVAEIGTLTDAATITPDFASNCNFTVTLGGARTIANPTNVTAGQSGSIFIVQDGTGGRTASWGSNWDWAGGTAPTLSTGANAVDRVDYICRSATSIHAVWTGNYS